MTSNLLAVLFNVFSQVAREQRGMVGEVITSYLAVSSEADVTATYEKVVGHLGEALQVPTPKPAPGAAAVSPTSHTMLDLLVIIVPFLPAPSARALFAHASAAEAKLIGSNDPAVQKKSYRILARLLETGKVTLAGAELESFVARLRDGTEVVSAGARRVSLPVVSCRSRLWIYLTPSSPLPVLRIAFSCSPSSFRASPQTSST
jgi:ribosomal RNA-processing protein 12